MASSSDDSSSDNESETSVSLSSYLPASHITKSSHTRPKKEAKKIVKELKSTKSTLKDVDKMLDEYNSIARGQSEAISKLKDRIEQPRHSRRSSASTMRSLRSSDLESDNEQHRRRGHYRTTSPLRDYPHGSDDDFRRSSRRPRARSAVRFRDEVRVEKAHLHDLHRSVRDLSADHERLEAELEREISQRYRTDRDYRRSVNELSSSFRRTSPAKGAAEAIEQRLEKKLENIATKIDRKQRSSGQCDAGKQLSEVLRQSNPFTQPVTVVDPVLQSRVSDLESQKNRLTSDLDILKQKYEQSEGSRRMVNQQVDDLRSELRQLDEEKRRVLRVAEEYRDAEKKARKKQREVTRSCDEDNQRLQAEIQDLKVQLSHSVSRENAEIMRRELQKNEKQRMQLAEHLENLSREVKDNQKHTNDLLSEVNELTGAKLKLEAQCDKLKTELEESKQTLKETNQLSEKSKSEADSLLSELSASERRKEEMKTKATEVVKLWKNKCKSLEKDVEKYKQHSGDLADKYEQLAKENDTIRTHLTSSTHQMDRLGKDMSELMTSHSDMEEKARRLETEVNDLKKIKLDLEYINQDSNHRIGKMEHELRNTDDRCLNLQAENAQLQDKLTAQKSQCEKLELEQRKLQADYSYVHGDLAKQSQLLTDKESLIQELEVRVLTGEAAEGSCRKEVETLTRQLEQMGEANAQKIAQLTNKVDNLKKENLELKAKEERTHEDFKRRVRHLQADKGAEIQAMQMDLDNAQSSVQLVKKQAQAQKDELALLESKFAQAEADVIMWESKYTRAKDELALHEEGKEALVERCRDMEDKMAANQKQNASLQQLYSLLNQTINTELRVLIQSAEDNSTTPYQKTSEDLITEVTNKTTWLRRYIREKQEMERQLRSDVKVIVSQEASERSALMAEMKKQQDIMDDLSQRHRDMELDVVEKEVEVEKLEDKVQELSFAVDEQREKEDAVEKQNILDRYERLQNAVTSLKEELSTSLRGSVSSQPKFTTPPTKDNKQVRISDIVEKDDGTCGIIKTVESQNEQDLEERVQAYNRALGSAYTPSKRRDSDERDYVTRALREYSYDGNYRSNRKKSLPLTKPHRDLNRRNSSPHRPLTPIGMSDEEFQNGFIPKSP